MAKISSSRYLLLILLLNVLFLGITRADIIKAFSFKNFSNVLNFESEIALYGDAKLVNGSDESLQISGSGSFGGGRVNYKKPFEIFAGDPRKMLVSFSVHFVFSLSKGKGDGLAFVMVPAGYSLDKFDGGLFGLLSKRKESKDKFLAIEFDTFKDKKVGDMNDNHVGIDVGSFVSVKSRNVSSIKLKSGEKFQSWIDYEAASMTLMVRLSKLGEDKPLRPLISCPFYLSHMWKENEVLVGLSASSSGNSTNSTQISNLYSWSFEVTIPPQWLHSEPVDPEFLKQRSEDLIPKEKKSDCTLKVLGAFIFGIACGALGAFLVLFIWTILGNRRLPVVPVDFALPAKEVDSEMTKNVVEKSIKDDGMKK